jgi:hypothetical protein
VGRVRHLDQDRLDHRHVGGDRHPVVEEPGIIEPALRVVDLLFVERPADALRNAAPDLAFDIGRMDRAANTLRRGVALGAVAIRRADSCVSCWDEAASCLL